jgi:hypothetical protein
MAFGGRTIHVDLVREEETWQWRGGVCIRNGSISPSLWFWVGPWCDSCTQRIESRKHTGPISSAHDIGIMGFLLSCRQAYTEGIDVLYSANCINIETERLLLDFSKFILHDRLASITSLEIVVEAHRVEQENSRASFKLDHLEPILNNIFTHCRRLRRLCLSLVVWQRHGHDLLDGPALPLVDAFWKSTQLRNMRVELPKRDYQMLDFSEPMVDDPREAPIKDPFRTRRWRSLDSEEPKVHLRSLERYPYPPLKLPLLDNGDKSEEGSGYCLCEGHEEAYQYTVSNCGI